MSPHISHGGDGPLVLGIESSCDETAAALVRGATVLSNVVAGQEELHAPFRGVVPEIASRAHAERISDVIARALERAGSPGIPDAIAVTHRPGLIGALLVGLSAAKALALAWNRPLVGVDHVEAHLHSTLMAPGPETPLAVLVASGGHTSLYCLEAPGRARWLGATLDDAAGEAFDKVAALLGLGFPGGPALERVARGGDAKAFDFPRPLLRAPELNFSFSGIKTAVLYAMRDRGVQKDGVPGESLAADLAASFQEAAVDVLVGKTIAAAERCGVRGVAVSGGVALNGRLRERIAAAAAQRGLDCHLPEPALCGDNAAMIAALGAVQFARGERSGLDLDAQPRIPSGRASRRIARAPPSRSRRGSRTPGPP